MGRGEAAETPEANRKAEDTASLRREAEAPTWFVHWARRDDRRERAPQREKKHLFHC